MKGEAALEKKKKKKAEAKQAGGEISKNGDRSLNNMAS